MNGFKLIRPKRICELTQIANQNTLAGGIPPELLLSVPNVTTHKSNASYQFHIIRFIAQMHE